MYQQIKVFDGCPARGPSRRPPAFNRARRNLAALVVQMTPTVLERRARPDLGSHLPAELDAAVVLHLGFRQRISLKRHANQIIASVRLRLGSIHPVSFGGAVRRGSRNSGTEGEPSMSRGHFRRIYNARVSGTWTSQSTPLRAWGDGDAAALDDLLPLVEALRYVASGAVPHGTRAAWPRCKSCARERDVIR